MLQKGTKPVQMSRKRKRIDLYDGLHPAFVPMRQAASSHNQAADKGGDGDNEENKGPQRSKRNKTVPEPK